MINCQYVFSHIMGSKDASKETIELLAAKAKSGDTESFGAIYDLCFNQIYRYVSHRVDESVVEDIVGNIFMKAWENLGRYQKTHSFTSWLFRIAHNTVIDHYRTNRSSFELHDDVVDTRILHNPDLVTEKRMVQRLIRRSLRKLEPKYREVLTLKFLAELENDEIAKALGTSEANIRTMQFRALKKLREVLENSTEHHDPKETFLITREAFISS